MTSGAPAILIEIAVEAKAPRVLVCCLNEAQEQRILDWVRSQDELADLVARALDLGAEARAG